MSNFEPCWQKELAKSFSCAKSLLDYLQISPHIFEAGFAAKKLFAFRVPRPFAQQMKKGDPNDPLLLQVITQQQELVETPGYVKDPLEEHQAVIPGLLHKYQSRVLMMLKTGCAINCRYCFRRHFPYQENSLNRASWQSVIDYVKSDQQINELILSGGDPLMAKDEHLIDLISQLEGVEHLTRVRIHTRLPVVIPQRVTDKLAQALANSSLKVVLVLHINHANEISEQLAAALNKLRQPNITLLNQAVLLKAINDDVKTQVELSERLFSVGILPYYLHWFDKVQNAAHFDSTDLDHQALYQDMLKALPGFLMPKWVKEEGGKASKTPIKFVEVTN
ncbi:EF-P beta-lysylation protein EpmB [Catenovulum sp. SM1970]|uniref:EF-P beta-lysylation protein EpmB n=1 Tax=Marinifaba aquimaris TaxID=2741323 RepID=UPI001571BDB8|nr:EF-P beta-lysylation protein EpmB [Marinifaba aquimaris]NTS75282.1 EF-P beta-lysylation protein EpmB [Marinifaba aquimaris]